LARGEVDAYRYVAVPLPAQEIAMPAFWNHRLVRHALPGCVQSPADLCRHDPAPQAVQALDLDARTEWPTHRIRSFLSMRDALQPPPGRAGR